MQSGAISKYPPTEVNVLKMQALDQFITFCALGGLITDENGIVKPLMLKDFCEAVGVDAATTWRWKKGIPNFAERVRQRRQEVVPLSRESAMINRLYIIGMTSKDHKAAVEALKLSLGHFSNLQLPVQRQDIKIQGGLMEVLQAAKADGIIEGETVEPASLDAGTGSQNTGVLPPAS